MTKESSIFGIQFHNLTNLTLIEKTMKHLLHLLFASTLFWTSCTTQRIAQLTPDVPKQYVDKDGFTLQKTDNIDVTFGYLFSTKDYLVFEVTVKNRGADSVLVNPQNFSFQPMSFLDSTTSSTPIYAHSYKQIVSQLNENARKATLKATAISLAIVASAIAIDAAVNQKVTPRYRDYNFAVRTGVNLSFNYFDALIFNQISKKEARDGLKRSLMFPQKIGKEQAHIGTVYFPRFDNAKQLKFNFKTAEQDFETMFRQTIELR